MEPHPAPAPVRRRRHRAAVAGVLVAVLLSGCGLRLETPPPAEPVPDSVEIVRRTAVSDALYVAEQAESAVEALDGDRARLTTELERVATQSREQAAELGGVYDSGLEPESTDGTPEASPSEAPVVPQDVVDALVDASGRSRTAAGTTTDGPLARLLASVGAAQAVSAGRVVAYTDGTLPAPVAPVVPEPAVADDAAASDEPDDEGTDEGTDDDASDGGAASALSLLAAPSEEEPTPTPSVEEGVSSTVPDSDEPAVVPRGLTAGDLRTLIESEDAAGYALRLRAARTSGETRDRLTERADVHTSRGQAWALVAGTSRTEQDPRQVAYTVPRGGRPAALVRTVESGLATNYASLVATTAPETRAVLVDLLVESAVTLDAWGAEPVAFPGLPEQQDD
ncbi:MULTISPECIES: DUF4439 domain-containing protein [Isoptericola]|uniref:DUF4439 domain-containing protein n=1 Tax=Isoptericola TaxID=254250 RepID=UPI000F655C07|nr:MULTISPECIES: DUF4439 domain-containing protein [Isoptericola]